MVLTWNWSKTQDAIIEWLRRYYGAKKAPLSYVARDDINPPPEADDPSTNYYMTEDEMIARAPIELASGVFNATYKFDNKALWDKLSDLLRDTKTWVHIKAFQREHDGRGALLSLEDFYLVPNMANELASSAESSITKARYTGETKKWTFDTYVAVHKA